MSEEKNFLIHMKMIKREMTPFDEAGEGGGVNTVSLQKITFIELQL